MRRILRNVLLLVAFLAPVSGVAQKRVEVSASVDVVSHFLWRGLDFGNAAIQPSLAVGWRGLSLGLWGSCGLVRNNGTDHVTKEIDVELKYSFSGFTIGLCDDFCVRDGADPKFFYFKQGSYHGLEAMLEYDFGFLMLHWSTYISGYADKYVNDWGHEKHAYASYAEISAPFRLGGFDWRAEFGFLPYGPKGTYDDAEGFSIINTTLRATRAIKFSSNFSLPVFLQATVNPESGRMYFLAGCTFEF